MLSTSQKFTDDQVREIRKAIANGESAASVARRLGVSNTTIRALRRGETYRRVTNADGTDLTRWEQVFVYNHMAQAKLLFDETVTEHLDIESIVFLSERLRQLLCGVNP